MLLWIALWFLVGLVGAVILARSIGVITVAGAIAAILAAAVSGPAVLIIALLYSVGDTVLWERKE